MKKGITYGTFDMFHEGHYNILKRSKELCDYLIVAVTGENYDIGRGKLSVKDSLSTRIENVKKTGFADEVIVEEYLGQKISDIIRYGVDVFIIGDDWKGKFDLIDEYCELVYLPRTEGISSTQIREETFDKHRIGIIADRLEDNMLVSEARKVSGFEVVSVYAEDEALAQSFAEEFGVERTYGDFSAFMDDIDVVYVATVLKDRYRYIKSAIKAGKNIISDAPFTINTEKEKELLKLAKEKNLILMHNLKNLHIQVFIQLLWMTKAGLIGDIIRIDCSASKNDKRIKQRFFELAVSALATVLNIMGTNYNGIEKRVIRENKEIEYMSMTLSYPDSEVIVNIGNNIRIGNKVEIVGTKGTIRLGENWWRAESFDLLPVGDEADKEYRVNYEGNGFKFIVKDMAIMMLENRTEYRLMSPELDLVITEILQSIQDYKD